MSGYSFSTTLTPLMELVYPKSNPGDTVDVTVRGVVVGVADLGGSARDDAFVGYDPAGYGVYLKNKSVRTKTVVKKAAPKWQPGDTIAIRFGIDGFPYTYVRGRTNWPGDGRPLSDADVNSQYQRGFVKHLTRDGQHVTA